MNHAAPFYGQPGLGSFWTDEAARARLQQFRADSRDAEIMLDAKDQMASWSRRAELCVANADPAAVFALLDELFDDLDTSGYEDWGMRLALATLARDQAKADEALAALRRQIVQAAQAKAERIAERRYDERRE